MVANKLKIAFITFVLLVSVISFSKFSLAAIGSCNTDYPSDAECDRQGQTYCANPPSALSN